MFRKIFNTRNDYSLTIARLILGVVFFVHGSQKMLGWFGGQGFGPTMAMFTDKMHIPFVIALLPVAAEFFGGLGLIVGFLGRIAAFGVMCDMAVAVALIHRHVGFFMNWAGTQRGEGYEYHLLALGLGAVILIQGSGALSIDRWLTDRGSSGVVKMYRSTLRRSA